MIHEKCSSDISALSCVSFPMTFWCKNPEDFSARRSWRDGSVDVRELCLVLKVEGLVKHPFYHLTSQFDPKPSDCNLSIFIQ